MTRLISITVFLVYLNVPTVLVRDYGLPMLFAAVVPMLLAVPVAHRVFNRGEALRFPGLIIAALLMLACHTASALLSSRPHVSLNSVFEWLLEGVFLAFLLVNSLRTREEVFAAVRAIVAAGAVMGFLAILQQVFGPIEHGMAGFAQIEGQAQRRLAGPIGEVNRFAQVMAVLIPVAAGFAITSRGPQRWLYWIATVLICGGMGLAFSRGTLVALVLVVPFGLLFGFVRVRHLALVALCGALLMTASPYFEKRMTSIGTMAVQSLGLSPGGIRNVDGASRGRVTEMQAAGLLFLEHPLLGVGPRMAPVYYAEYAVLVGGKVRQGSRRTHNLYLQLAAETGLVGLFAFLGMIAMVLLPLDRARRSLQHSDRQLWGLVCGLELAVLLLLATSLFLHAAYIRYFWLLLALAGVAASLPARAAITNFLFLTPRNVAGRIGKLS